jgi:hypothetical protein
MRPAAKRMTKTDAMCPLKTEGKRMRETTMIPKAFIE